MNIIPSDSHAVVGTIFSVTPEGFESLKEREAGYEVVDMRAKLDGDFDEPVYAFIAPDIDPKKMQVPRSYLETCTAYMNAEEKSQWIADTIIPCGIYEDVEE